MKYQRLYIEGHAFLEKGLYKDAVTSFSGAIRLNPFDEMYYLHRGISKGAQDDFIGMVQDCNRSLGINPNRSETYYYRSIGRTRLKDYVGAISDASMAIEVFWGLRKYYSHNYRQVHLQVYGWRLRFKNNASIHRDWSSRLYQGFPEEQPFSLLHQHT